MDDGNPLWRIGIILILIMIEAIVSSAKKALELVNENSIKKLQREENAWKVKSERLLHLLEDESKYVDTAQFLVCSINILIGLLCSEDFVVVTIIMVLTAVLFGTIIPSRMTVANPEVIALNTSIILSFLHGLFYPFVFLFNKLCQFIFFILRISPEDLQDNVTEDEIISIVNEGFEQGILEDSEAEMISNIMELDDKEVRDVMTNRRNVVSISTKLSLGEALKFMLEDRYSRFPLYEGEKDNVIGVLHLKDVTQHYIAGEDQSVSLKQIAREPYFVPDTQSVDTLFEDMQLKKIHMAIAVDEYGQMAGVVALEDILEEIVGNILDEYDEEERMVLKQGSNRYVMRGMASLEEVEEVLGIDMEQKDYDMDTLNGFLISRIGRIPGDHEKPVVYYEGYRFHVLDAKNNMIRTVRVVKEQKKYNNQLIGKI